MLQPRTKIWKDCVEAAIVPQIQDIDSLMTLPIQIVFLIIGPDRCQWHAQISNHSSDNHC